MWNNFLRKLWNIAPSSQCEMKFALHICEANISQRSYFTWRSHISLAEGEFRWKKHTFVRQTNVCFFLVEHSDLNPNHTIVVWSLAYRCTSPTIGGGNLPLVERRGFVTQASGVFAAARRCFASFGGKCFSFFLRKAGLITTNHQQQRAKAMPWPFVVGGA